MLSALFRTAFALFTLLALLILPAAAAAGLSESYGRLPLHFEENRGQAHKDVRFLARGPGYGLYLTAGEAVLALGAKDRTVLRMALVGANADAQASGLEELPGKANYFVGKDPAKWHTSVPTYARVNYREVYPGIDVVYYGNQRQLEYDFVVAPGADPNKIVLGFKGANKLEIDAQGELVLHAAGGNIRQRKPVIYQEIDGVRREVAGGYVRKSADRIGFQLAAYDTSRPLVIDPVVLAYSTYLGGGSEDLVSGIAVGSDGHAYMIGQTRSINFPATLGSVQPTAGGDPDAFVTKLNPAGSALVYSTYLGGSGSDGGHAIAVDAAGNAYVTGSTASADFPATAEALRKVIGGATDAFVAKLDSSGSSLVYSTFLGGSGGVDWSAAIALDAAGNAYVTGSTESRDFPTTPGAFQPAFAGRSGYAAHNAFVSKLNAAGSVLVYSTYLGGYSDRGGDAGSGIAVDASGNAYVTGWTSSANFPTTDGAFQPALAGSGGGIPTDAFVTKLNPDGSTLVYSTFLGGTSTDRAHGIAVDQGGNAFVTGGKGSSDFPATPGAVQGNGAFVTKLDPSGSTLAYSAALGGPGGAVARAIAVDAAGRAHVTGETYMTCGQFSCVTGFPTTPDAFQPEHGGAASDAFLATLDRTGSTLVYSTYFGGSGADGGAGIAVDTRGGIYLAGWTNSGNLPVTVGAFQPVHGGGSAWDGFVAAFQGDGATGATVTRHEEDAASYQGYWPTYGSETGTFSGGTIRATNQATATATFTFTGTAVSWIGVKCNVCGIATVQIDGGAPTVVDTFGPGEPGSLTSEPVFTASGLAPGATHTLTIVVTGGGTSIPGALTGSAHVAVDAFDVTN